MVSATPQACIFIKIENLAQVFSCEFCQVSKNTFFTEHQISKNTLFTEHLWTPASKIKTFLI